MAQTEADAAGVPLGGRVVGVALDQASAVGEIAVGFGHHASHSAAIKGWVLASR